MYPLRIKEKYDPANLNGLAHRFTVVYLGTYKDGDYTENIGSHPGVDIVPVVKNQEILSVLDGKIFKTGEDGAYGKFVFIEHTGVPDPDDFSKTTTLFSCYEHLSEVRVNVGDIVKEGTVIGKTGNTGNSFGEHLHFQIDRLTAPFHAYWPFTGAEAKAAGATFTGAVNIGLGIEKARLYTLNPLVYLDKLALHQVSSGKLNKTQILTPTVTPVSVVDITPKLTPITSDVVIPAVTPIAATPEKINIITSNDNLIVDPSINILSSLTDEVKKKGFNDIIPSDKYYNYIMELYNKGYITGYKDAFFKPNNAITRTEFLKLIFLVKGTSLSLDINNYFIDVGASSWQKKYINTAVELGLVNKNNKKFFPDSSLTRVEALKMAILLFVGDVNINYSKELLDVGGAEWYAKYVAYAIDKELLPYENNFFMPTKNITRYEVIQLLFKLTH